MNFDQAFTKLLGFEGAYSNHPNDPGGETNWGVTVKVAREFGYTGSMRDLSQDTAKAIYRQRYWDKVQAEAFPATVRYSLFDVAVNSGVGAAIKLLQRACGVIDDGVIGPMTIAAAAQINQYQLASRLNGHRLELMTNLKNWDSFSKGWARRVAANLKEL